MSWREILKANPYAHNSHNTHNCEDGQTKESIAHYADIAHRGKELNIPRTKPEPAKPASQRKCCFWYYQLNPKLPGFTQMGLMTDSPAEAQRQLTEIYGHPVEGLHRKEVTR